MSLSIKHWSTGMKTAVAAITGVTAILGAYMAVEAWADDKITEAERRAIEEVAAAEARAAVSDDRIIQAQRLGDAQANIRITEIQIEDLEDEIEERENAGREPTEGQKRRLDRLIRLVEQYEAVETEATEQLASIEGSS